MKVSCLPVSLFPEIVSGRMGLCEWLQFAAACGLDGADFSVKFLHGHTYSYLEKIKWVLAQAPVPVVMCTAYPDLTHPDPIQQRREMDYLKCDIALCSELSIPYLRVHAGRAHPGMSERRRIDQSIRYIRALCAIADAYGVVLLYENYGKTEDARRIDAAHPPHLFLEVLKGLWDTSVRVNFDIGSVTAAGDDPVALLEAVYPKVETIHVSDMQEKGVLRHAAIGTGAAPIRDVFRVLKEHGFDGWLCVEEASFAGKAGVQRAISATRQLWQEA